jgi:thermostable 8-oxoguanine DNA glycosylase
MLKNLRLHNIEGVPKTTPTSKKLYKRLENEVLNLARDAGMTPADYDLNVWNKYSIR